MAPVLRKRALKVSNDMLINFINLFKGSTKTRNRADLLNQAEEIIAQYVIPQKYLENFEGEELLYRKIELISKRRGKRPSKLYSDQIAKERGYNNKKSSCTTRWRELYPQATSIEEKSKITGIPIDILEKVKNKGEGAFLSSGSRPGQTPQSWGNARVNCFLLNKPTVTKKADYHLFQRAIDESPKARKWFENTKW